jgi:hypothetical protein
MNCRAPTLRRQVGAGSVGANKSPSIPSDVTSEGNLKGDFKSNAISPVGRQEALPYKTNPHCSFTPTFQSEQGQRGF